LKNLKIMKDIKIFEELENFLRLLDTFAAKLMSIKY
jgi:hypothetical protein